MLCNHAKHSQQSNPCTLMDAGHLQQLYSRAMQMEADFFAAQPGTPGVPQLRLLVVDFDETCTASDSTSDIMATAVAAVTGPTGKAAALSDIVASPGPDIEGRQQHPIPAGTDGQAARQQRADLAKQLAHSYSQQHSERFSQMLLKVRLSPWLPLPTALHSNLTSLRQPCEANQHAPWSQVKMSAASLDQQALNDWVAQSADFDREMNQKVVDAGVLAGIRRGSLAQTGVS